MTRKLKAELSNMMRSRIPLTDKEIQATEPWELFQMALAALEGIREEGGNNRGKWVEMIQYAVGLSRGDAWCMAACQAAVRFVELWKGIQSPLCASGHCLTVFKNSKDCQVKTPEEGDLIVYQHGDTQNGHVEGIVEIYRGLFAFTMGGNTSSGPGIEREGDGEFFRMRTLRGPTGDMKIYGFLRPFSKPASLASVRFDEQPQEFEPREAGEEARLA